MGCISDKEERDKEERYKEERDKEERDKEERDKECDNKKLKNEIELSEKLTNQIITDFLDLQPPSLPQLPPRPIYNINHTRIRVDLDDANEFIVIESEKITIEEFYIEDNHIK